MKVLKIGVIIILLLVVGMFVSKAPKEQGFSLTGEEKEYWELGMDGWTAVGTPPACPEPLRLASIADVNLATSVLYPGQMRSVGYEPTAGYRFDGVPNNRVTIMAPIDGKVVQAARFLVGQEVQYVFDIISPCGIMVRLDHLLTLTPKFMEIASKLPEPREGDSRSTSVFPRVDVVTGEEVATAVGISKNQNTFVSFTVFDFRRKNKISQDESWAKEHPALDHYVICPYPLLPESDYARIKSLPPADMMSGSKSDYCI